MTQNDERSAQVVEIAYELARTGRFEDFSSLKREIVAEGFAEAVHRLETPAIRHSLDEICEAGRRAEGWHRHTAA